MYRFYGGTRETSIERDMADVKWVREHGKKGSLTRMAKQDAIINVATLIIVGLVLFGVIALIVWGIQNLVQSGFSWQLLLFNPITWIVLIVGGGISAINRA